MDSAGHSDDVIEELSALLDDEFAADACESELGHASEAQQADAGPKTDGRFWVQAATTIPMGAIEHVRSICREPWVARMALELADARICRRLRTRSDEARRARWSKRWEPRSIDDTKKLLGRYRDVALGRIHREHLGEHKSFAALPKALIPWRPDEDGRLVTHDMQMPNPSVGSTAFMEQTPPKLLRWACETWRARHFLSDDVGRARKPNVWDLTAGSGTSVDLLGRIHGCPVVASDLTVVTGEGIYSADCRQVGSIGGHRQRTRARHNRPSVAVHMPDIVFFDPPSRGTPTHADLYDGPPEGDLAALSRDRYLDTLVEVVARSTQALAPNGFVSLVLRCGTRQKYRLVPDPALVADFRARLEGRARITSEMPVVYAGVRNQTSLGKWRVPAVHLTIERAP